jgi:hypothetical protein
MTTVGVLPEGVVALLTLPFPVSAEEDLTGTAPRNDCFPSEGGFAALSADLGFD